MIKIAGKTMNKRGYIALTALVILISGIALSINLVSADTPNTSGVVKSAVTVEPSVLDKDLQTIDVVIRDGDTAWDIQSELTPNKDVNEIIAQLELVNEVDLEKLSPGDIIKFAINK